MSATPGPWSFDFKQWIIVSPRGRPVILVNTAATKQDVALIAAAPDLLAACRAVADNSVGYVDTCRAAIAKAEGKA
jgi:hypothetical protein